MSGWRLTCTADPADRIDAAPLAPERLDGLTPDEVRAIPLVCGRHRRPLHELFELEQTSQDGVVLAGTTAGLENVGAGMGQGTVTVEGDIGAYAGAGQRGGEILIRGGCGSLAGAGMAGGVLTIAGDAGDFLGAPRTGDRFGLTGGRIRVYGSAGDRAAERMRRGMITIDGDVGDYAAVGMVAGTLAIGGSYGAELGLGLRRGTLILGRAPDPALSGFVGGAPVDLAFLRLLLKQVGPGSWLERLAGTAVARRWVGDRTAGGQGEILALA